MFETDFPNAAGAWLNQREPRSMGLGRSHLFTAIEAALDPLIFVFSLWAVALYFEGAVDPGYLILSVIVFSLTFPGTSKLRLSIRRLIFNVAFQWLWIAGLLLMTGLATGYFYDFSMRVVSNWLWIAPLAQVAGHLSLRAAAPQLLKLQGPPPGAVIVGVNHQGVSLARQITGSAYSGIELLGFFDDRGEDRRAEIGGHPLIGKIDDLPNYVKRHRVQSIYLSLPMASRPRILQILDGLKDTTASIYFVPDMFITDLIQGRSDSVCGVTVISVCDTPFRGLNRALKRCSDVTLSVLILLAIFPVMLLIALLVKLESPGPAIFRQRRYGLDGDEIVVYKFRSMAVTEDGGVIEQARKNDSRVTRLGSFLRRTSLDELPQFFNVIKGDMSLVGPRPPIMREVKQYESWQLRRLSMRPGITCSWQVSPHRNRISFEEWMKLDLNYIDNWSLKQDLLLTIKTIRTVIMGSGQ